MKYYKVIVNNTFICAVNSGAFLEENPRSHRLLVSTETNGQFVDCYGLLYRDYWMRPVLSDSIRNFIQADVIEITKQEYDAFIAAISNNEEIIIDDDDDIDEDEPIIEPTDDPDLMLEFIRGSKLVEMSHACRLIIEAGFDLEIRGETQHFSLSTQDQLNLMNLNVLAETQELIPYHADGETCVFYTAEEIKTIAAEATQFKIYQTTYYNALKDYINALDTIEAIAAITYGTPIPEEYKSDVLRVLE